MSKTVPKRYQPDEMERAVLDRWRAEGTFEAQVEAGHRVFEQSGRDPAHKFIFLEGPPTANGMPHPGHVLTRTLKDSVNRFHAMQGKWVPRNAGWDCHGLPVEIEVQKELGIEHVDQIEEYGVAPFLEKCKESVFRYKGEWEKMSARVGFWVDFDEPYVTMDDRHIESVWWSLKKLFDAGLLAKAHKVVPYSPVTGTTYSSHEVAQGYKDVVDTSVFVKFHLKDVDEDPHGLNGARVLSWTTTPWTLPGNVALAVGADIDYVKVKVTEASGNTGAAVGEELILAEALFKNTLRDHADVVSKFKGRDLVGRAYEPLFPGAVDPANGPHGEASKVAWEVVAADFVTTEDGTGVVHTAVMYGEDDYQLGMAIGLPAQHTVGLDGNFIEAVPHVGGLYVKDEATETAIFDYLRDRDMFYRSEQYEHSYPHCWRTNTPLLYYAMDSWYIRMSTLRDKLLANNDLINWVPETIKEGRMGDWLRNVKDWAFSRSRYWGTPLPVWICDACEHQWCAGSKQDLAAVGIEVPELHRPHVDTGFPCKQDGCSGTMQREPYVIDVWYDSGAAQFAQFPQFTGDADQMLAERWPIDFIAEGLDQTRGWFYSLLAIATALGNTPEIAEAGQFQGPPFKNVVVNGLILAEDGRKMSKSLKNYVSPDEVFEHVGADATRWYLLSATAPWQDKRFFEDAVRDTFGKFFSTLWNTYLFHHQYADLDNWKPSLHTLDQLQALVADSELDRWLLSRLEATVAEALGQGNRFHLHKATRAIEEFVINDLSNWWVRRSRDRFWAESDSPDKQSAHATLWWALHSVCRLVAPFAPFMVEHIWSGVRLPEDPQSVHLARYPEPGARDEGLEGRMSTVRQLAEAGRALRSKVGIPTRHPLGRAVFVGNELGPLAETLRDELNVKRLEVADTTAGFKSYVAKPNRAKLGPAFKQLAPMVADAIEALDGDAAHAALAAGRTVGVSIEGHDHELNTEHVQFDEEDREGWATTEAAGVTLALHIHRNEELMAEALTREVIRRVQDVRKELDLHLEQAIDLQLAVGPDAQAKLEAHLHALKADVRARNIAFVDAIQGDVRLWELEGEEVRCAVTPTETLRPAAAEAA